MPSASFDGNLTTLAGNNTGGNNCDCGSAFAKALDVALSYLATLNGPLGDAVAVSLE